MLLAQARGRGDHGGMKVPKACFFDVFGTLVDWRTSIARESEAILFGDSRNRRSQKQCHAFERLRSSKLACGSW